MTKANKTQYSILGLLSLKEMSGYELKKLMDNSTQFFWRESTGQIYPTLAALTKQKLVTVIEKQTQGKRISKIYKITSNGLKKLKEWLELAPIPEVPRSELLLKLFFGYHNKDNLNQEFIMNHKNEVARSLQTFKKIKAQLAPNKSVHLPYWLMTVRCGELHAQAELLWCEEIRKQLKKLTK